VILASLWAALPSIIGGAVGVAVMTGLFWLAEHLHREEDL
jgi:hypothetical protein